MKSNAIVRIIIWGIVLVVLAGILVLSLFPWLIQDSFIAASSGEETAIPIPLETAEGEVPLAILPNEEELTFPADINEIEIEWVAGDIVMLAKDVDEIMVSESDVSDEKYSLLWKVQGNKLEILFCSDHLMSGFGIANAPNLYKDLYIYVPMDWEAKRLEIDAASANVEMHNILSREMDFDGASGTCDFHYCSISDLDIDTASGDVTFSGTLDTLDFDAASASFIGELQNTPSRIDMDSMSGKLDIALPEDCGYTVTMDGMSSRLSSGFKGTSIKNGSHVYGDGRCRINVDGMSCDVTLRKLDTILVPTTDPTEDPAHCTDDTCMDPTCSEHGHDAENCTDKNCTIHGHTAENCTDENCTIHGHTAENCTDENCTIHGHTAENCADENCTIHGHSEESCTDKSCAIHTHNSSHH